MAQICKFGNKWFYLTGLTHAWSGLLLSGKFVTAVVENIKLSSLIALHARDQFVEQPWLQL
jgi:hypothetical protein